MIQPNPGSKEAQEVGCTCPVIDNHYGRDENIGFGKGNYWISEDCPIHSKIKQ